MEIHSSLDAREGCVVKMMVSPCLGWFQAQPMEMSSSTPVRGNAVPHAMEADLGRRCLAGLVRHAPEWSLLRGSAFG